MTKRKRYAGTDTQHTHTHTHTDKHTHTAKNHALTYRHTNRMSERQRTI
jgi:hypothetical protein